MNYPMNGNSITQRVLIDSSLRAERPEPARREALDRNDRSDEVKREMHQGDAPKSVRA